MLPSGDCAAWLLPGGRQSPPPQPVCTHPLTPALALQVVFVGEDTAIDAPGLAGRRGLAGVTLVNKVPPPPPPSAPSASLSHRL